MRKLLVILFAVFVLFGCTKNDAYKDDDIYEFAKTIAVGFIEMDYGYHPEKEYILQKIEGEQWKYSDVYQILVDDKAILLIEFEYVTDMHYGGYCFSYKDGYMLPTITSEHVRQYKEKDCEYSVSLNSMLNYEEYQTLEVIPLEEKWDSYVNNKMDQIISHMDASEFNFEYQNGDKVYFGSPILSYSLHLNEEKKSIEVVELNRYQFPVYVNDEVQSIFDLSITDEESCGYGFDPLYGTHIDLLKTGKKYVNVVLGDMIYGANIYIAEDGTITSDSNYPVYINKAQKTLQDLAANCEEINVYKEVYK